MQTNTVRRVVPVTIVHPFKQIEFVAFDATNISHRIVYAKFLVTGKWSDGIRFHLEETYTNIPSMIERKLLRWFLEKAGESPRPHDMIVPKLLPVVFEAVK